MSSRNPYRHGRGAHHCLGPVPNIEHNSITQMLGTVKKDGEISGWFMCENCTLLYQAQSISGYGCMDSMASHA